MVDLIQYNLHDMDFSSSDSEEVEDFADYLLRVIEKQGMKPPLSTCKMVEDTYNGGTKHGSVEHKWDEE